MASRAMSTATRLPTTFAIAASGSGRPEVSTLRAAFWYSERADSSDGVLGESELPVLEAAEFRAERAALPHVPHRMIEGALAHANPHGGDADPAHRQAGQRRRGPCRDGDHLLVGDEHVGELHVGGELDAVTHLQIRFGHPNPVGVHVDQGMAWPSSTTHNTVMMSAAQGW